ncbi:hypothetical protein B4U84_13990 [Westiellopsis prolifica IICB1]|nr:hypothetical protein B4U84_13990 [Westiellopsis prolifica IICB1]
MFGFTFRFTATALLDLTIVVDPNSKKCSWHQKNLVAKKFNPALDYTQVFWLKILGMRLTTTSILLQNKF